VLHRCQTNPASAQSRRSAPAMAHRPANGRRAAQLREFPAPRRQAAPARPHGPVIAVLWRRADWVRAPAAYLGKGAFHGFKRGLRGSDRRRRSGLHRHLAPV